jgi:HlyD family type I secretion membrane fusion protein
MSDSLETQIKKPLKAIIITMALIFGFGGVAAATFPIAGAVIAMGVVSPEGSRQTIQHREGGIVDLVNVREGQKVSLGEVLVTFSNVDSESRFAAARANLMALIAKAARLKAERMGVTSVGYNDLPEAYRDWPEAGPALQAENRLLSGRQTAISSQASIVRQQGSVQNSRINSLQQQLSSLERQRRTVQAELQRRSNLAARGLALRSEVTEVEEREAALSGAVAQVMGQISEARVLSGEAQLRFLGVSIEQTERIEAELTRTLAEISSAEASIAEFEDRDKRRSVKAPFNGIITDVRTKVAGAIVQPGGALLDIVPTGGKLRVEARVKTVDIDQVRLGQKSIIAFSGFSTDEAPRMRGAVTVIAPDVKIDPNTGNAYYPVTIEIVLDGSSAEKFAARLVPGMPVDAYIQTKPRTLLKYLSDPLTRSLEKSFRDG